jgi:hypothetical protein
MPATGCAAATLSGLIVFSNLRMIDNPVNPVKNPGGS